MFARHDAYLSFPAVAVLGVLLSLPGSEGIAREPPWLTDDFEQGLDLWMRSPFVEAEVRQEEFTDNKVLELVPAQGELSFVVTKEAIPSRAFIVTGRFLFPDKGDGYLGFIWGAPELTDRLDYASVYIKQNGGYVRVSPHFDGNPSWRLYEDLRRDLPESRRPQLGQWTRFRLVSDGKHQELYIGEGDSPVVRVAINEFSPGRIGFEARPRGGEKVWVDDVRIAVRPETQAGERDDKAKRHSLFWEYSFTDAELQSCCAAPQPNAAWQAFDLDRRGAAIVARQLAYSGNDQESVLLKTEFYDGASSDKTWLSLSTANRVDVWLNKQFVGSLGEQSFIWADHVSNPSRGAHRVVLPTVKGCNELLVRVHGGRFAGGGLYLEAVSGTARASELLSSTNCRSE